MRAAAAGRGWLAWAERVDRFLFEPVPTVNAVALRIGFGVLAVGWALSIRPDLLTFFSADGVLPVHPPSAWSLLLVAPSDTAVLALWLAMLVAGVGLILGVAPRAMCAVVLVALVSFLGRNPYIDNSGDLLLRNWAFLFLFLPMGTAATLPIFLRDRTSLWSFPDRPVWPLRLVQVQLSLGYLFSFWAKVRGETWIDGTAVGYALRIGDLVRWRVPETIIDNLVLIGVLTYGTLVLELALAILIWRRSWRPALLAAGALLHLAIHATLEVGFFSWAMLLGYLAFVPSDVLQRVTHAALRR